MHFAGLSLLVAVLSVRTAWSVQRQFDINSDSSPDKLDSLASIPQKNKPITIKSKYHPDHRVRIKAHDAWCDPTGRSYTGYIDAGSGKQLFFYFFESRRVPVEDPVVMWINGGPGASSAMGLFMEQGPCRIKENPQTVNDTYPNPYAWNEKTNIFFVDQPIGVGFSHGVDGQSVVTTEMAAIDIAAFIDIFFDTFKEYQGLPFHMTGESYGGRYLPVFASEVFDQNARLVKQGRTPINLKSVMIGNGGTSFFKIIESSYEFMCSKHIDLGRSVLDIKSCVIMAEALPRCNKMLQKNCLDSHDYTSCAIWMEHCVGIWSGTAAIAKVNWYNVNETCTDEEMKKWNCLPAQQDVQTYLDLQSTRTLLGIDPSSGNFSLIRYEINRLFVQALDSTHQTYYYVANLLERGIKVLNYVGTLDAACDHIGQGKWMAEMGWSGQEGYLAASTEDWLVDGQVSGSFKTFGPLAFMRIYGAGHLVPTDKPKEALTMYNEWIDALIDNLEKNELIESKQVAEAMRKVDRKNYVPDVNSAYEDSPQRIGFGATISAPHMHAHACENLLPLLPKAGQKGGSILDVGSGSGYLTAVLHHLAPHATVIGIDHLQGLVEMAKENLGKDGVKLGSTEGRVEIICGDGRLGSPQHAPFQIIHVGAAAPDIPQPLIDQLASPGRMFIPVDIWQVDKSEAGEVIKAKLFGVMYVPLTDPDKQWREPG
ncbi:MAG: hypothetical protein TREMPRED_004679 [Tremellales sp. Tagirdzhanova-0007]|nr:MAG: hypothetical protein TREMPRED_004679 [Tremellales sp. Tagirdzhanova-0007]